MDVIKSCQSYFSFQLPSAVLSKRVSKFNMKFKNHQNQLCRTVNGSYVMCKYYRKSCQYFVALIHCVLFSFFFLFSYQLYGE